MDETEQINIRLPKSVIRDLNFCAKENNTARADLVRTILTKSSLLVKEKITRKYEDRYINGFIEEKDFKRKLGYLPNTALKEMREKTINAKIYGKKLVAEMLQRVSDKTKGTKFEYGKYLKELELFDEIDVDRL